MDFSGCPGDRAFGPHVRGCRDDFDFTLKFEQSILSILPGAVFIACAALRLGQIYQRKTFVAGTWCQYVKVTVASIYAVICLSLLALSAKNSSHHGHLLTASTAVTFVAAVVIVILSFNEHAKSARPSMILNAFLAVTLLLDIAIARTLWLVSNNALEHSFVSIFTTTVALKTLLLVLESRQKTSWVVWDDTEVHSPEETTGLYGLSSFFWLNTLFMRGFKQVLHVNDLFVLTTDMTTAHVQPLLEKKLTRDPVASENHALLRAVAYTLRYQLLIPVIPRVALIALNLSQSFIIQALLTNLALPSSESINNHSYGLIGATIIVYTLIPITTALYKYKQQRAATMARAALASAIYAKTTQTTIAVVADAASLTLMSTDTERICSTLLELHEPWANAVQVAIACYLLYRQLGVPFVAPLVVVIFCMCLTTIVAKLIQPRQIAWMKAIESRVAQTSNTISAMKYLKISGMARPVEMAVHRLRVNELLTGSKLRWVIMASVGISFLPMTLGNVCTFGFIGHSINVTTLYTSVSYLTLLTEPLSTLLQVLPSFFSSFACMGRIQKYLEKESLKDYRVVEHTEKTSDNSAAIALNSASFGWTKDTMAVKDLTVKFPRNSLTMVIGPVACGKSTLCTALLGEVPYVSGSVILDREYTCVGYSGQAPFLLNATIRENIVGFSRFDPQRYADVIHATMLETDLALLDGNDSTKIGSNGIGLSGGQKQRVALARALYQETELLILDDIISSLDATTAEGVFKRLFGRSGLLRRRQSTVIMCTHAVSRIASADHVVVLSAEGTLVDQGTWPELEKRGLYTSDVFVTAAEVWDDEFDFDTPTPTPTPPLAQKETDVEVNDTSSVSGDKRSMGDHTVFLHYFRTINTITKVSFLLSGIYVGFSLNYPNIWLKYWSDDMERQNRRHSTSYWIGIYAFFQITALVALVLNASLGMIAIVRLSGASLHKSTLRAVFTAPLRFYSTTDVGQVTNLFSQDTTLLDTQLPQALLNMMIGLWLALGSAAVIASSSGYITIFYPFIGGILYFIQRFYLRTSRQLRLLDLEAKSPLYSHFTDTMNGLITIRAFNWASQSSAQNRLLLDTSQRPAYLLAMIQHWLEFVLNFVVAILATLVVVLATQMRSNAGFTGASMVSIMSFGSLLAHMVQMYTLLETSIGAVNRLKTFSEQTEKEDQPGEIEKPGITWPQSGDIEILHVDASYNDPQNLALKDITLSIKAGEKVSLCGRTGSGKSSMVLLLLRLLEPIPGTPSSSLTINGLPISAIDRTTLRECLISVPQDAVFLPGNASTRTNLDPMSEATPDDCIAALTTVGLHDLVTQGVDTPLASDALSQGQKQLFSLARALIRRRIRAASNGQAGGVLILDEVSSSVDAATEKLMMAVVDREFAGYTVVSVSHHLDAVLDYDRIFVMDSGRVVEQGAPRELLKMEGSRFSTLYNADKQQQE